MQTQKLKTLSILLATLLVGGLIGALLTGALVRNKLQDVRALASRDGFIAKMEEVIKPDSPEQQREVQQILSHYGTRIESITQHSKALLKHEMDSMTTALQEVVSPQQLAQLEKRRQLLGRISGHSPD
ncbi:hypothetical protein [Spongorhabdus nitratireducens]